VCRERFKQPEFCLRRDDRNRFGQRPRTVGEAGNTQIVVLGLRNRSRAATGWNNDTVKLEHSGPEGGPVEVKAEHKIDIESLSHDQRDQLREILLAAKALATKVV